LSANSKYGWWVGVVALVNIVMCSAAYSEARVCDYDINDEWPWLDERTCQASAVTISTTDVITPAPLSAAPLLLSDDNSTRVCESTTADPDGDGWRWENNRSCIARVPVNLYPYCQSATSDADGDGWGWENQRSCIVDEAKTSSNTIGTTQSTFPVCSSQSVDPDGDGWGWENNRSCTVAAPDTQTTYPPCISTDTDPDGDGWGWEGNSSCIVDASAAPKTDTGNPEVDPVACTGDNPDTDGDGLGFENGAICHVVEPKTPATQLVFAEDFSDATPGQYGSTQLNESWGVPEWHLGFDQGRATIVYDSAAHGNALQVTYPAGAYGATGASAFLSDIQFGMDLPESYEELYLSYDLKFGENFEFVLGGKLPGLCGHDSFRSPYSGCNTGGGFPSGFDGWSARGMWRQNGALENYVYHSSQRSFYGDDELWNVDAVPGQWHNVQHRIVMNTVGQKNGIIEAWLDGRKVLSINNIEFRKLASIGINQFYFSTFFGGNDSSWAPSSDQIITFDNFAISTDPVIGRTGFQSDFALGAASVAPDTGDSGGGGASVQTIAFLSTILLIACLRAKSIAQTL